MTAEKVEAAVQGFCPALVEQKRVEAVRLLATAIAHAILIVKNRDLKNDSRKG